MTAYKLVQDKCYGYYRLDPIPTEQELSEFYQTSYYDSLRNTLNPAILQHLMAGGKEAKQELYWLRHTLYADIAYLLNRFTTRRDVLDIGSGTGALISYLKDNSFFPEGIEPSPEGCKYAKHLTVHNCTFGEFTRTYPLSHFSAVTAINVLEHLPDPLGFLKAVHTILSDQGLFCLVIPNDFSALQAIASLKLNKTDWWIAKPDHINYFNFQSAYNLLNNNGFEVIYAQSDFPMEFFLLMGEDYIDQPETGARCHAKQMAFELSLPSDFRRSLYQSFASIDIGRNCLILARRKA